jgi:hypothetical protein
MMEMRWHIGKPVRCLVLVAVIVLTLVPLTELFLDLALLVLVCMRLMLGWLFFLVQSLRQASLDGGLLASFLIGLGVTAICLHMVMVHFVRQWPGSNRIWRWKWTLSLVAIPLILFGVCVAIQGAVTTSGWLFSEPLAKDYSRLSRRSSASRLARLGKVIGESSEEQTHFPSSVHAVSTALVEEERLERSVIYRDLERDDVPEYWTWLGAVKLDSAGDIPVAFAPRPDRNGVRVVAFLDGTAKECTEEEWQAALERWRQAMAKSTDNGATLEAK